MLCLPVFCFSVVPLVGAFFTVVDLAADGAVAAGLVLLAGLGGVLALAEDVFFAALLGAASFIGRAAFWLVGF